MSNSPAPSVKRLLILTILAVASFHLAHAVPKMGLAMLVFLYALVELTAIRTPRKAFYLGLGIGLFTFGPQLLFFYTIFSRAALALWLVLAFWTGLFLLLGVSIRKQLGDRAAWVLLPFFWTGLEYFRSELYYLRFSWLNVGLAQFDTELFPRLGWLGMYGIGFVFMAVVTWTRLLKAPRSFVAMVILGALLLIAAHLPSSPSKPTEEGKTIKVAGIQMEFPDAREVLEQLNLLVKKHPQLDLVVLPEYTFDGPIPPAILAWCKRTGVHLVAGGKEALPNGDYFNTAFVIGPSGEVVFKQAKSVPIQFFKDGRPAEVQQLWDSPWGKVGIAICYDFSYRRVIDRLVAQGAQLLIIPTMDVVDWGAWQHALHGRVAPVRAGEYKIPIVRICSSGVSQMVEANGKTIASGSFPGENQAIVGELTSGANGRVPWDRLLAPLSVLFTGGIALYLATRKLRKKKDETELSAMSAETKLPE